MDLTDFDKSYMDSGKDSKDTTQKLYELNGLIFVLKGFQ